MLNLVSPIAKLLNENFALWRPLLRVAEGCKLNFFVVGPIYEKTRLKYDKISFKIRPQLFVQTVH